MTLGPLMIDLLGKQLLPEERELLKHPLVGGVILFTKNFESREQIRQLVNEVRALRSPPLLVAVDYEGGRVQRFRHDFTQIPPMRVLGRAYDQNAAHGLQLARQTGWLLAAELRAVNIDLSLGPVVDLDYGASSVIGDRALHHDARVVAELAVALMHGMRDAGMHAVAKHFPGHGAVVADSHVTMPVDHRRYADISNDMHPYARLIENGLGGVMSAHVVFDQVDDVPATFSRRWLKDELRNRLRFKGAVFSDDLTMEGASIIGTMPQRVSRALSAGCDMVLICHRHDAVIQTFNELSLQPDPASQVRLAGIRGVTAIDESALFSSAQWQHANAVMQSLLSLQG
ncbi:MAG TPA: beta-N-acetylhexosaminidase [Steroidobacteraceae bacterium]|nr:beta-N-acetylhexosaminidase [Steroidobacteraceae bacterium]